jgi:hypothetical protein
MSLSLNYPTISPSLLLDFANSGRLDPQVTFTRSSTATFFDETGVLRTANNDVPRFDYNPATLAAQGLLIEESRTNLLTYSEAFDTTPAWSNVRSNITANAATSPAGTLTADELVEDTTVTNTHYVSQSVSFTAGTNYTVSVFAKATSSPRFLQIVFPSGSFGVTRRPSFDLVNGTTVAATDTTSTITPVGNGWYRCTATMLSTATASASIFYQLSDTATNSNPSYTGDGISGLFLWGAQLEAGAFATSVIPTTTTALTRAADVASVNTLSPWFNSATGTMFAEYSRFGATNFQAVAVLGEPTFNNLITLGFGSAAPSNNNRFDVSAGGVSQSSITLLTTPALNTVTKNAGAYAVNDFAGTANGAVPGTDTSGSVPSGITVLSLGCNPALNGGFLNGYLRRIAYYPVRLPDAQLQAITA